MGTFDGFDCSTGKPNYKLARSKGFRWVVRYLSYLPNAKVITAAEVKEIHAAGLGLILNWEFTGRRALGGRVYGLDDGAAALRLAKALGYPRGYAIPVSETDFSVQDGQFAACDAYYRAFNERLGGFYKLGIYGPAGYLKHAHANRIGDFYWQPLPPYGWNGNGQKWDGANIWQTENGVHVWGGEVDLDKMNPERRIPVWFGGTPPKPPAPIGKVLKITQPLAVDIGHEQLNDVGKRIKLYVEMVYNQLGRQAALSRLRISSNYDPSKQGHGAGSYHYKNNPTAVDFAGIHGRNAQADKDMRDLAKMLYSNRGSATELIHSTPFNDDSGFYVKDGVIKPAAFFGEPNYGPNGHINHVHWAVTLAAIDRLIFAFKKAHGIVGIA